MKRSNFRNIIFLFCCIFITSCFFSCNKSSDQVSTSLVENTTSIKFSKDFIDFGEINSGEIVTCSFKFKNTGKNDLIITSVSANCGCTVADYPREKIKPQGEGQITVRYDSKGSMGIRISKEIYVLANTLPPTTKLRIAADIN
ncbi:MAG: DUF1573 domain-containing protein [Bacteroidales bacterium]|jgi:hypothetical protein|nr:DUF1573 domain-containing protein [Bacteroidales bacterium]